MMVKRELKAALSERIANGGAGIGGPYYAETASAKGNQDWPWWIVRNATCNSLGTLLNGRESAERIAAMMNQIEGCA